MFSTAQREKLVDTMEQSGYSVAIIGCTGAVGQEMITSLHRRKFPISNLSLYASQRSAGKTMTTPYGNIIVTLFSVEAARSNDIVLMAVSGTFALEHGKAIAAQPEGALVIDNSSAFRYDDDIPLVVPEINCEAAEGHMLIANPNCTTAIASVVLWPLHQAFGGLKRVIVSTYQASSGAGAEGMAELQEGTRSVLNGGECPTKVFAHPLGKVQEYLYVCFFNDCFFF